VADAFQGGCSRSAPTASIEVLADEVGGDPIRYADAVVIAADGLMYFTDASRRLAPTDWGTFDAAVLDIMEHSCTGRVLVHDPGRRSTALVIGGLCFPNGVALSGDGRHLFIAETGEYRIWEGGVLGTGPRCAEPRDGRPERPVIADNLPGFPDNLTRSAEGAPLDRAHQAAQCGHRRDGEQALAAVPDAALAEVDVARAAGPRTRESLSDEDGRVVADLQDPAGRIAETSGVTETGGGCTYTACTPGRSG